MNEATITSNSLTADANPPPLASRREFDLLHQKAAALRALLTQRLDELNEMPMSHPGFDPLEARTTALSHEAALAADLLAEVAAVTEEDRRAKAILLLQWSTLADDGVMALAASLARDVLAAPLH